MKLQSASKKEIRRIAIGTAVCDVIMVGGLFLASQFDIGSFDLLRILLGAAGGSAVAILNFTVMCLTVQSAVNYDDQKKMKAFIQGSYNGRLALQALWVVICIIVPQIHTLAGAAPLLFPNLVIFWLQMNGRLVTPSERKNPDPSELDELEDRPGSFEL